MPADEVTDLPLSGLFFAIGHEPATAFLDGQVPAGLMLVPH
jgi:thioredoxin reductase